MSEKDVHIIVINLLIILFGFIFGFLVGSL